MLQNYNRYALLKIFLYNPLDSFRLRELCRLSKISPVSVINYLKEFETEGIIKSYIKRDIPFYQAVRDNEKLVLYKKISAIYEINISGLTEFLWNKLSPEAIILYGSYAKGESTDDSDIDIAVIGKIETKIDLTNFEKMIGKKIHLFFHESVKKISREMLNNLANGIIMKGYLNIF